MKKNSNFIYTLKKTDKIGIVHGDNEEWFQGYFHDVTDKDLILHEYVSDTYRRFEIEKIIEISKISNKNGDSNMEQNEKGKLTYQGQAGDKKIPVATHLTDQEYKVLMNTYAIHNSSMSLKERVNYGVANIVKVEVNKEEKCLEVHYDNGDWWHYTPGGNWY